MGRRGASLQGVHTLLRTPARRGALRVQTEAFVNAVYLRVLEGRAGSREMAENVLEALTALLVEPCPWKVFPCVL